MGKLRQILGIAYIESRTIKRQPLWIVQAAMGAIGFVITIFAWGGSEALRNLTMAYVVINAWSMGLNVIAQTIGWAKIGHDFERLVASPVTLPVYFTGVALGSSPFILGELIPAVILAWAVGMNAMSFMELLALAPIALVLGAFTTLTIVLRMKNPTNISSITNPLVTITTSFPPVYYPIRVLPPILREISLAFPTTSLMEVSRWFAGGQPFYNPLIPAAIIVIWLAIITFAVARKLKWGLE